MPNKRAPLLLKAVMASWLVIVLWNVTRYYPLTDDYILLEAATRLSVAEIFANPLIGFYRPVAFTLLRAEVLLVGWNAPWLPVAVNVVLHVLNALLVRRLVTLAFGPSVTTIATFAAGGFFISPWATEATLWMSGIFDVLGTSASLVALSIALADDRVQGWRRVGVAALPAIAALIAVMTKEFAVTLPIIAAILGLITVRGRWVARVTGVVAIAFGVALGLVVREQLLPGLGGVYGNFGSLMSATLPHLALSTHLTRLVLLPFSTLSQEATWVLQGVMVSALGVGVITGSRRRFGAVAVVAAALLVSLVPVLWANLPLETSSGGRVHYFPGVFASIAIAWLLADSEDAIHPVKDGVRVALSGALLIVLLCSAWS